MGVEISMMGWDWLVSTCKENNVRWIPCERGEKKASELGELLETKKGGKA